MDALDGYTPRSKTFDIFAAYWPSHADIWPGINDIAKYVASTTLTTNETDWPNVTFLNSVEDIVRLRNDEGGDIKVHGSGNLVQTLLEHDLVDELHLITYPITLGTGKKLFGEGTRAATYTLIDSVVAPNGVIFASYKRDGDVKTGTVGE